MTDRTEDQRGMTMVKEADDNAGAAERKSLKRFITPKRMILVLLVLVLLASAGAGAWFFFFRDTGIGDAADTQETVPSTESTGQESDAGPAFEEIVDLEPFDRIPLKPSGKLNFITLSIAIELFNPAMRADVEREIMSVRQAVEMEARNMTWLVLRNPDGKLRFKFQLLKRINSVVPGKPVRNIYFTQLIMQ